MSRLKTAVVIYVVDETILLGWWLVVGGPVWPALVVGAWLTFLAMALPWRG